MLLELSLKNFAVIDNLSVRFADGLNVITGETGTGKSIIVDAVNFVFGGKYSTDIVKTGAEEAVVEALFSVENNAAHLGKLESMGLADDGKELLLRRIIPKKGRGRVYINGSISTNAIVAELSTGLIDIFSQHEHQSLLKEDTHLRLLDEYGSLAERVKELRACYVGWRSLKEKIEEFESDRSKQIEKEDYLKFQLNEIDSAGLVLHEDDKLEKELKLLSNAERLKQIAERAYDEVFEGTQSIVDRLKSVSLELDSALEIDPDLKGVGDTFINAIHEIEDAAFNLRQYASVIQIDPDRLTETQNRIEEINNLKRKYKGSIEDILNKRDEIEEELNAILNFEVDSSKLRERFHEMSLELDGLAQRLTGARRQAAASLMNGVNAELGKVGLKNAELVIELDKKPVSQTGADKAAYLFTANPDSDPKPIAKVASGGELSRLMLVLKETLMKVEGGSVLIFDEADSGIGGAVAETVGIKIKNLANKYQVICITHLPQVAKLADNHLTVSKKFVDDKTVVDVRELSGEDRVNELARMLGGLKITQKTIDAAREMLDGST